MKVHETNPRQQVIYVKVRYTDGGYTMYRVDAQAKDAIMLRESTWNTYQRHVDQDIMWNDYVRLLDEHSQCPPPEDIDPKVPF